MTGYWLICVTKANFDIDRANGFQHQGFKAGLANKVKKMQPGDKVVYYITKIGKFGAIAEVVSGYYHDDQHPIWPDKREIWPARARSREILSLEDGRMLDVKKILDDLSFVETKDNWGIYFRGSLHSLAEEDYKLIESEMRKLAEPIPSDRSAESRIPSEQEAMKAIMDLPGLTGKSPHDRIGEMLEEIGTRMGYNASTRQPVYPDRKQFHLDVAWLRGKNPEIAIEVQIGGKVVEAKEKLRQARSYNYRKTAIVTEEAQLEKINELFYPDHDLMKFTEAWSIVSVYRMYVSGKEFLRLFAQFEESRYQEKSKLELR